jgi:hypothetical protein
MNGLPHRELTPIALSANDDEQSGNITRRVMIVGAAATTAVVAIDTPAQGQGTQPNLQRDMVAFVLLSAALTGIAEIKLAPGFAPFPLLPGPVDLQKSNAGSDPVNIKQEYFDLVRKQRSKIFLSLLDIARELAGKDLTPIDRTQQIIDRVQQNKDTKYLARSIVLMWYLGAWYDPDNLRALAEQSNPSPQASNFQVISSKAYTQAWALRVAQAHPMGFSEMQFGYWTHKPQDIVNFIGKEIV